jgi:hypothetical protein
MATKACSHHQVASLTICPLWFLRDRWIGVCTAIRNRLDRNESRECGNTQRGHEIRSRDRARTTLTTNHVPGCWKRDATDDDDESKRGHPDQRTEPNYRNEDRTPDDRYRAMCTKIRNECSQSREHLLDITTSPVDDVSNDEYLRSVGT